MNFLRKLIFDFRRWRLDRLNSRINSVTSSVVDELEQELGNANGEKEKLIIDYDREIAELTWRLKMTEEQLGLYIRIFEREKKRVDSEISQIALREVNAAVMAMSAEQSRTSE